MDFVSEKFFDSFEEAFGEANNRKAGSASDGWVTRIKKSPYGGWTVTTLPIELDLEMGTERLAGGSLYAESA